ncbi:MAG TPA: zinc ribbon domain-containing protein [Phycisphaerales bacterium]|nr:zinc ribbon domain-containing protein [Phycisphaerales bacterium]
MPTYDYRCTACDHRFELFHSMSEKPKRTCPKCGKAALERLIGTGAAVLFKGSGFYQTDYRSESYKKAAESESKEAAPAGGPEPGKAEAKPASGSAAPEPSKPSPAKPDAAAPAKREPKPKGKSAKGGD